MDGKLPALVHDVSSTIYMYACREVWNIFNTSHQKNCLSNINQEQKLIPCSRKTATYRLISNTTGHMNIFWHIFCVPLYGNTCTSHIRLQSCQWCLLTSSLKLLTTRPVFVNFFLQIQAYTSSEQPCYCCYTYMGLGHTLPVFLHKSLLITLAEGVTFHNSFAGLPKSGLHTVKGSWNIQCSTQLEQSFLYCICFRWLWKYSRPLIAGY